MEQKIIRIGNSIGITLPKKITDKLGLKPGNKVNVEKDPSGDDIIISKSGNKASSITPGFLNVLNRVNKRYQKALQKLANT